MGLVEEGTSWWLVGLLKAWLLEKKSKSCEACDTC